MIAMKKIEVKKLTKPFVVKFVKSHRKSLSGFREAVKGIIEMGQHLLAAKKKLPHGAFLHMVENELPCDERMAQRLMTVGRDRRLRNPSYVTHLPARLMTLHDLSKLTDEQFEHAIVTGAIKPDMQRRDVEQIAQPNRVITTVKTVEQSQRVVVFTKGPTVVRPLTIEHESTQDVVDIAPHVSETEEAKDADMIAAKLIERYGEEVVRAVAEAIDFNPLVQNRILARRAN
jgi:hypothetical protein